MERKVLTPPKPTPVSAFKLWEEKLPISKAAIDQCVIEQAEILYHVATSTSRSMRRMEQAKDDLRAADHKAGMVVRDQLADQSKIKVTEAVVVGEVNNHPLHTEAEATLRIAQKEYDDWAALKEAVIQRGYMIRELCGLLTSVYSSDRPTVDPNRAAMAEARRKKNAGKDD